MTEPIMSECFENAKPSAIRLAQQKFMERTDDVEAVNTAIGNVSLPAHPVLQSRFNLKQDGSPFIDGAMKYSATVGMDETRDAFLNIIRASGFDTENPQLYAQITEGGSHAMYLVTLGCGGRPGVKEKPLLLIDAAYTNYKNISDDIGRCIVSITRTLQDNGKFTLPDISEIEKKIIDEKPNSMVVIPYDNPTGHFYDLNTMAELGKLCVKHNLWMISDEAYRELFYTEDKVSSIWGLTEDLVPGITGRRISIETASKVWNACGLRIGALVTDNEKFHKRSVAKNTNYLCPSVPGQYIFGALAHENMEDMNEWFKKQRDYYSKLMTEVSSELKDRMPDVVVSSPDASIYSVVDVKKAAKPGFDAMDFVLYCAQKGSVDVNGKQRTLLVSPMTGFYNVSEGEQNPGKTQMRVAYVAPPQEMKIVPELFEKLFKQYEAQR